MSFSWHERGRARRVYLPSDHLPFLAVGSVGCFISSRSNCSHLQFSAYFFTSLKSNKNSVVCFLLQIVPSSDVCSSPLRWGGFVRGGFFLGALPALFYANRNIPHPDTLPPFVFLFRVCKTSNLGDTAACIYIYMYRYSGSQMAVLIALGWAFTEEAASITPLAFALHSSSIYLISLKTFRERKERDPSCPACTAALGVELGTSLPRCLLPAPIHVS